MTIKLDEISTRPVYYEAPLAKWRIIAWVRGQRFWWDIPCSTEWTPFRIDNSRDSLEYVQRRINDWDITNLSRCPKKFGVPAVPREMIK